MEWTYTYDGQLNTFTSVQDCVYDNNLFRYVQFVSFQINIQTHFSIYRDSDVSEYLNYNINKFY